MWGRVIVVCPQIELSPSPANRVMAGALCTLSFPCPGCAAHGLNQAGVSDFFWLLVSNSPVQCDGQHIRKERSECTFCGSAGKQKADYFPLENVVVNTGHVLCLVVTHKQ